MESTASPERTPSPTPNLNALLRTGRWRWGDTVFRVVVSGTAASIVLGVILLVITMFEAGLAALIAFGPSFVWSTVWNPVSQVFGVLPAVYGTIATSALALVLAVPVGIGAAIFLAELAPRWLSNPISFLIEMLAAIPSVIIGFWGLFVVVPLVRQVEAPLGRVLGVIPMFSGPAYGIGLLAAGVVLAIMILPILTAVARDVLRAVPTSQREAMLALGATRWETIARAVVPYARSGIVGATILALGRALGETLAVSMVIGNTFQVSPSLFAPATTLASLIATQFREADTALYLSALIAAGFVLFVITMLVNVVARILVWKLTVQSVEV
ncbi:MAG: phosphate ABC transporter permease subunit PstC [Chloroflexi bacterium]|nr:phosphate ABC transporter permease subunit PstC [Chloroflexota bacterium]